MRKIAVLLVVAVLALGLLSSCPFFDSLFGGGGGSATGITIAGTVQLDSGVSASGSASIVIGITDIVPLIDQSTQFVNMTWISGVAPLTKPLGAAVAYSFAGVPKGNYLVVAWIDTTANGRWDAGEPNGTFPAWSGSTAPSLYNFQGDYTGANITLQAGSGGGTVTISGTITPPAGVTPPTGALVVVGIVDVVPSATASAVTWSTAVSPNPNHYPAAASVSYSFSGVPAGDYMVIAWVDLTANDTWEANEPSGTFPEWTSSGGVLHTFSSDMNSAHIVLFQNPLSVPATPAPTDTATGVDFMILKLDWADCTTSSGATITYDVFAGETTLPTTKNNTAPLTASEWALPAAWLMPGKTYKWQVVAHDSNSNTSPGPVWTFATAATSGPTHRLQNWDFQDAGFYDSPAVYHYTADVVVDVMPSWAFSVGDNGGPPNFEVNIGNEAGNNYVILKQLALVSGNAIAMSQGGVTSLNYSIAATSTLAVRFQIRTNGYGNTMYYDCSPLDVRFKIGDKWYIVLFRSDTAHVAGNDPRPGVGVALNQWYVATVPLSGYTTLQMHDADGTPTGDPPITLSVGTVVQTVMAYIHNDYYETWIDYIDITQ
jgi:hypothetical protein